MVNHWRKTAETALVAESAAKAKTEEALTAETAAKAEAVDQRDRANQNFALARGAVDNLFTEVSESALLNQPGTQPLRRGLLEQARNYYDTFLSTEADNEQLADELAASQFRVGRIIELTESKEEALDVYAEVAEQQRELVAESPDDLDRLAALSTTINAIGRTNHELQQIDEAQANYDEARQLREQLVALDPDNHEFHRLAANSTMNLGLVTRDLGDPDRAAQLVGESIDKRLERIERGDRRATLRRDLAMGYFNLALLAVLRGEQDAAREPLLKAVEVFESLDSESGDNSGNDDTDADVDKIANLHRLAISYRLLGDLQFSDVTSEEAEQWYENARYRLEQLVLQNPTVSRYESDLANLMINQADREARRDDLAAARESFQRSSDIQMRLWERFGEPAYLFNAAVATREMALTQWQLGEDDQARETLENLAALLRRQDGEFDDELAAIDEALEMVDNEGEAESPLKASRPVETDH
jgi:tetratricopeptide (TPR) repeat protein